MAESKKRLPPETFDIDLDEIRRGYYSAVYFWREKQILEGKEVNFNKQVLMQVFQKDKAKLCGIDEALAILRTCSGCFTNQEYAFKIFDKLIDLKKKIRALRIGADFHGLERALNEKVRLELNLYELWVNKFGELRVEALHDSDSIEPWETALTISGLPQHFAHLESVYLGILAQSSLVATNVARVVEAAAEKMILFFADRFSHYKNQASNGYAAMCGGAKAVATDIMGEWWGNKGGGTMPHALIGCFKGDTVVATIAFAKHYPDIPCISLVDFHNDCAKTALDVAETMKAEGLTLWGVRLDTSENMVDASITRNQQMGSEKPTGVNPMLVNNVRRVLDRNGHDSVKIVVSGGFTAEKIAYFERIKVPVDGYGCGSSLLKGDCDFTADIVMVDGQPCAKVGRWYRPNPRLEKV